MAASHEKDEEIQKNLNDLTRKYESKIAMLIQSHQVELQKHLANGNHTEDESKFQLELQISNLNLTVKENQHKLNEK